MDRGPVGGRGHPVHRGGRPGQEFVTILHLRGVEPPAWALRLRIGPVKVSFLSKDVLTA